jgi:adenylate cyclase
LIGGDSAILASGSANPIASGAQARTERRLVAILAADVAGYSRLTSLDEADTHQRLMKLRSELLEPQIGQYGGRVIDFRGDGALADFPSLVRAAEWPIARAGVE